MREARSYNVRLARSRENEMAQKIISQVDADGNATVLLNRPEVRNAFDDALISELTRVFLEKRDSKFPLGRKTA